jgi:hypothetical protein
VEKRRGFFLAASVLAAAIAIASACSFPEPTVIDADGEGGPSSSSGGDGSNATDDGSVPRDAALVDSVFAIDGNQNVDPDGASQEASVAPEGGLVDATGCNKCNCDGDKANTNDAASGCATLGNDCNDLDPFIPHDGFVASEPNGHSGDWDCDGVVTKQFPVNIDCGLLANCSGSGFSGDPACGTSGPFVTCKPSLLPLVLCETKSTETVVQGCR